METLNRRVGVVAALTLLAVSTACVPTKTGGQGDGAAYAPPRPEAGAAQPAGDQAQPKAQQDDQTLVLPLLSALFFNGQFVEDLKTKAGLSAQEVEKVRAIATEEYGGQADMSATSETDADKRAQQKIREAVGPEKADKVFGLVRQHWGEDVKAGAETTGTPKDTRVVVNAPAYRMDVWQNGQLVKTYKVGIGYPEFPLASGLRRAETIIFNPEWVPPDETWVSKDKVTAGEHVKPGDPRNPLGPVKIPLGGGTLIHGGKAIARLGSFASHGCIGLTTPQVKDFITVLAQVAGEKLTPQQVEGFFQAKTTTKHVALDRPVPIELRYDTITVEDGKLNIYRDVYGKGTNTEENLRSVLQANGLNLDEMPEKAQILAALQDMAKDAFGNPAQPGSKGTANPKSSVETKAMKGEKVKTFELAQLAGKGYPAPVALDNGTGKPAKPGETTTGAPAKQNAQAAAPKKSGGAKGKKK